MGSPSKQRGIISTLIAIIVLVITLMAAVALMRSVDTSNTIAGSLTFRQGVVLEAERAYVDAVSKIAWAEPTSDINQLGTGYYASPVTADTTRPDLPKILTSYIAPGSTPNGVVGLSQDSTNNYVYYIVERMCTATGAVTAANCIVPGATALGGTTGGNGADTTPPSPTPAYRLTVRVQGQKGTLAYVQTMLH